MNAHPHPPYHFHPETFVKRAVQGAAVGLVPMLVFMFGDDVLRGERWTFGFREYIPMIAIMIGGAVGGMLSCLLDPMRYQGGWRRIAAIVLSVVVFIVAVWISSVAGFAVTGDWD